jgi:hypothetical protein
MGKMKMLAGVHVALLLDDGENHLQLTNFQDFPYFSGSAPSPNSIA